MLKHESGARSRGSEEPPSSRPARAYAWATAGPLSFLIPVLWAVALGLVVAHLPSFLAGQGNDLTPSGAPAPPGLLGLFPSSTCPAVPGTRERGTTAITYLFFDPTTPWATQQQLARRYAATYLTDPGASVVGMTGTIPARLQQEDRIAAALPVVEIATVVLVAVIIALAFGSVLAPLITLLVPALVALFGSTLAEADRARAGLEAHACPGESEAKAESKREPQA
jgi:hypothetical protein